MKIFYLFAAVSGKMLLKDFVAFGLCSFKLHVIANCDSMGSRHFHIKVISPEKVQLKCSSNINCLLDR